MPIRFPCPHCHRPLKARTDARDTQVKCPGCRKLITVPSKDKGNVLRAMRAADHAKERNSVEDVYAEFVVYEDEQLDMETGEVTKLVHDELERSEDDIVLPRRVVYMQGALLAIMAVLGFSLGAVFGWLIGSHSSDAGHLTAKLTGRVTYITRDNQSEPDVGAVIIALPTDRRPDEKLNSSALRPDRPPPGRRHSVVVVIESIGGAFARADSRGEYQLKLSSVGDYFVLLISGNRKRRRGQQPASADVAQLGRYFLSPTQLLGDHEYRWYEQAIDGALRREVEFPK